MYEHYENWQGLIVLAVAVLMAFGWHSMQRRTKAHSERSNRRIARARMKIARAVHEATEYRVKPDATCVIVSAFEPHREMRDSLVARWHILDQQSMSALATRADGVVLCADGQWWSIHVQYEHLNDLFPTTIPVDRKLFYWDD